MEIYGQLRTMKCVDIQEDICMACEVDAVFFADCAARSFFDQVANKWSVMILTLLTEKPTRFNEIKRRLEGITHKALTQALRRLERNGLIAREVINASPVAVEYSITELGRTLQVPFGAVYDWSIKHLDEIEQAQNAYDRREGQ
ncbi:winged helix-turn-helix transcriptional regulator [Paraburkholderia sp. BR10882]|uniref:winged helix-turn-helix transcriptional regulator n=1 Tax=unclassified Paraburkholderia TaxID=2615204 RepID=UPI0034CE5711